MAQAIAKIPAPPRKRKPITTETTPLKKAVVGKTKTTYPVITYTCLQFNLKITPSDIGLWREEVLKCIPDAQEREIFSNETKDANGRQRNIVRYPLVQFRVRDGYAVIWAMQGAVALVGKFVHQYKKNFTWRRKAYDLKVMDNASTQESNYPIRMFNSKLVIRPVVYRLNYYIPFTNAGKNKNYDWIKNNSNLPDTAKTKKIEELMTNHLCSVIHYAGGFIPKQKIKLTIIDKKLLEHVTFDGRKHLAYDIRYTVNLYLPDFIALGNKCSHGFGWQRLEKI
jgi:hypothetical protein